MATQERIRWTSSQVSLVHEKLVTLTQLEFPELGMSDEDCRIPTAYLVKLLPVAQHVLDKDFHRKYWAPKQVYEWATDCSRILRKKQLDKQKQIVAITGTPTEALMEELARRMTDRVSEMVLDRLEGLLTKRVEDRIDAAIKLKFGQMDARARHSPVLSQGERAELPVYAVVGLLDGQQEMLLDEFSGKCELKFAQEGEYRRAKEVCKDRICFILRHVDHSIYAKAKSSASKLTMVNGHLSELRLLLAAQIREFNSLSATF